MLYRNQWIHYCNVTQIKALKQSAVEYTVSNLSKTAFAQRLENFISIRNVVMRNDNVRIMSVVITIIVFAQLRKIRLLCSTANKVYLSI